MGQNGSTHHEPLDRIAATNRRSLKLAKTEKRGTSPKRMDRLRRSFRDSFRRRKEHVPESTKPHQWQADESGVRAGTCTFHVKYLGCVEVFESRGMQVCEEALKVLRNCRRRPVKAILHVSGDGLRVVEDETKGLIVDQTIEKVSFCAPDRNHDKGFSYICRDGTTRRWMCHGFFALRESGERLSHAVGCAFAACLERKQKRDKECGVTMTFDPKNSTFTRTGSFRQTSITDRLQDPQEVKSADPPPVKNVSNPFAIERPHATVSMLQRQGSFRGFQQLNQASPFKRQMSLRIGDLPSTLERQRSQSLEGSDFRLPPPNIKPVSPIPESSPIDRGDSVSAMCQQLSQGLSLLSRNDDDFMTNPSTNSIAKQLFSVAATNTQTITVSNATAVTVNLESSNYNNNSTTTSVGSGSGRWSPSRTVAPVATLSNRVAIPWGSTVQPTQAPSPPPPPPPATTGFGVESTASPVFSREPLPRPEQWLGYLVNSTSPAPSPSPRRAPGMSQHSRAYSLGSGESFLRNPPAQHNANGTHDPFDAEWAAIAARNQQASTNPFVGSTAVKAFQVHM